MLWLPPHGAHNSLPGALDFAGDKGREKINRNFLGTEHFCKCSGKKGGIKSTHKEKAKRLHFSLICQEVGSLFYCHL